MISIIVPTLGNRKNEFKRLIKSLEFQKLDSFELIVVSQDNHKTIDDILATSKINVKHIQINKKGLSNARNEGLKYINGSIVTFGDDDCWYPPNILEDIEENINLENMQIACFNIMDPLTNEMYKNYKKERKNNISELGIFKISSIEIFINLKLVSRELLKFDERFGLGAIYKTGEENILLNDLYKNKYKISYIPKVIVYHSKKKSSNSFTKELSFCRGAVLKRMFPSIKGWVYTNLIIIKHIKNTDSFLACLISANKGFFKLKQL